MSRTVDTVSVEECARAEGCPVLDHPEAILPSVRKCCLTHTSLRNAQLQELTVKQTKEEFPNP